MRAVSASLEKAVSLIGRSQSNESTRKEKDGSVQDLEKTGSGHVNTPIRRLTWRSLVMGVVVSMGGFIFGYDIGQISGILEMEDFLHRFGEPNPDGSGYEFSNVRSGLIVALVRAFAPSTEFLWSASSNPGQSAFYWNLDWRIDRRTCRR